MLRLLVMASRLFCAASSTPILRELNHVEVGSGGCSAVPRKPRPVRRRCLVSHDRRVTLFAFPEQLFNGLFNLVQHPIIPCPEPATCPPDQIFSIFLVVVFFTCVTFGRFPPPTPHPSLLHDTDTDGSNQTSWFSSRTHQAPRCAHLRHSPPPHRYTRAP